MEDSENQFQSDELDVKIFPTFGSKKPVQTTSKTTSIPTDDEYYDTTHDNRGMALIFNHMKFKSMNRRNGSDKDRDDVSKILKSLDFEVRKYNDLSRKELLAVLNETSKEDHSKNDCFVVVVMSHGETGTLYASDELYPVEFLWKNFVGDNCKSLIGKPKLFFVQACRGEKLDAGVSFYRAGMDSVDAKVEEKPVVYTIPAMADLLVMYSTYEGHYAWRNPKDGSWFIQALCKEFKENGSIKDLLTLLTGVSRRVAFSYQSNVPENAKMDAMKQMPSFVSMLTKILYFTKKIKDKNKIETEIY